jgi:hypothetical protein
MAKKKSAKGSSSRKAKAKKVKVKAKAKAKKPKLKAKAKVKAKAKKPAAKKPAKQKPARKTNTISAMAPPLPPPLVSVDSEPSLFEDAISEPLNDSSGIFKVREQLTNAQRDADEDNHKRFPDPSLVAPVVGGMPASDGESDED